MKNLQITLIIMVEMKQTASWFEKKTNKKTEPAGNMVSAAGSGVCEMTNQKRGRRALKRQELKQSISDKAGDKVLQYEETDQFFERLSM